MTRTAEHIIGINQIASMAICCALVAIFVGCAPMPPAAPVEQVASVPPPRPPEPAMHVTQDVHLNVFGEMPHHQRIPFKARPGSPMKQHSFVTEGADFDVDISPNGKDIVFASTRHTSRPDIYMKSVDGRAVTQMTSDPAPDVQPCFSPDGKNVVFASYRSGNWDLWMISVGRGRAKQITRSSMHEVHPSFSPDGKRLVYCMFNNRAAEWELWVMNLNEPGAARMIGVGLFPEWSPTSESIVYQRARERGGRWFSIWRMDLVNGEPQYPMELASSPDMALIQPNWSPDGEWVTYGTAMLYHPKPKLLVPGQTDSNGNATVSTGASNDSTGETVTDALTVHDADQSQSSREYLEESYTANRGDIWIMKADGSSPVQLTPGISAHFSSVWGPDGRIYFTSLLNGSENIWSVRPLQVERSTDGTAALPAGEGLSAPKGGFALELDTNVGH